MKKLIILLVLIFIGCSHLTGQPWVLDTGKDKIVYDGSLKKNLD